MDERLFCLDERGFRGESDVDNLPWLLRDTAVDFLTIEAGFVYPLLAAFLGDVSLVEADTDFGEAVDTVVAFIGLSYRDNAFEEWCPVISLIIFSGTWALNKVVAPVALKL